MIPEGLLVMMPRGYGRLMYRAQKGYEQMCRIRAWCGCRQFVEGEDDEREQKEDMRHVRSGDRYQGIRHPKGLDAPERMAPPGRCGRRILRQRRFRRVPRLHHGGRRPDEPGGGVPRRVQQRCQEDGPMAPIGPLPSIECAICGRHPSIPFQAKPTRRYLLAKLRDDGWSIRMLGDGRYVGKCPDCCDLQERMNRDDRYTGDTERW